MLRFFAISLAVTVVCLGALPVGAQGGKKGASSGAVIDAPACTTVAFTDGAMVCSCAEDTTNGSVWGSGPYTADSNICTAARHAGAVGEDGGVIQLTERPGQDSYTGSTANGVTTSNWGSYGTSYDVSKVGEAPATKSSLAECTTIPSGADTHACSCPAGKSGGSVWGNGPYTADSDICTAALHNGYIDGSGGDVYVLRVQGLASYLGGDGNGVTTSDWNAYDSSIIFDWNQ